MPDKVIKDFIENVAPYGGLGAFGGIALYLNQVRNGATFKITGFIINAILSGWIGVMVYSILPSEMGSEKIALVSVSGFLSYPILSFLESEGFNLILKRLGIQPNTTKKENVKK